MTKPIYPFIPTSNLIEKEPQITLDLVSKDVEKTVLQKMRKNIESGQVQCVTFTFCVSSKVCVHENLKNVFRKAMGKQSISNQNRNEQSDTLKNRLKVLLNLSSKNAKNERAITFLTFTTLSIEPTDEELEDNFQRESRSSEKNSPPPIPSLATHPARRAGSNPCYRLVTERKNSPGKIRKFLNKCFARKFLPVPQTRYTLYAFDNGFECEIESKDCREGPLNISRNEEPIYEEIDNFRKRKSSGDTGYETIKSIFSDSDYEVPLQVEPVIYLEVLP
ncbi:MAG: hypothetical protein ACH349_00765 [Candidatus Rhabdochlamydia sp.]